jgi:hypothetical protein
MFSRQNSFKSRSGRVNHLPRKHTRARLNLEALEERRVPAAAVSGAVVSTVASAAEVTPAILPPPHPGLAAPVINLTVARSATEIDLHWTTVSGALGYRLEDSISGSNTWTILGGFGTSADLTNLNPDTTYLFQADAYNQYGTSSWSYSTSATTYPAAPTVQVTGEYQTGIGLSWNTVPGANYYTVQVGNGTPVDAAGTTDYVYGLSPGTTYTFIVTAYNTSGGTPSAPVRGTTQTMPPNFTVAAASAYELDVNWNAVGGSQVSYEVSVASYFDNDLLSQQDYSVAFNPFSSSYTYKLTNLAPLGYYVVSVGAMDSAGTAWATPVDASTDPSLLTPYSITATAESASKINLSWQGMPGSSGYQVEYSTNNGASWTMGPDVAAPATSVNIMNLSPATTYMFRVNAYNASVTSGWSGFPTATTFPSAPTVTITGDQQHEIDLGWNSVPGATSYTVQETTNGGFSWTTLPAPTGLSDRFMNLNSGDTYVYRVGATNASGTTFSNGIPCTTLPGYPAVTAKGVSGNEIDLSWNPVNGANGYTVEVWLPDGSHETYDNAGNTNDFFPATGLLPDQEYWFTVSAYDAGGTAVNPSIHADTLPGTPTSVTIQTSATTITAGSPLTVTIHAWDMYGVPCNDVNVSVSTTTGLNWSVPISDGVGTVPGPLTFTNPGTVVITTSYGNVGSDSKAVLITVDAVSTTYPNWSGYAAAPGSGVTAVGASWVEPAISGSKWGSDVAIWTGIDGLLSPAVVGNTVEQCGVTATNVWGTPTYTAWYEFYGDQSASGQKGPDYLPQTIPNFTVNPGDKISASVSLVPWTTQTFLFQITDQPAGGGPVETFSREQTMQYVTPQLASADWIVENANFQTQAIANFSPVSFDGAWATVITSANGYYLNGNNVTITDGINQLPDVTAISLDPKNYPYASNVVYAAPSNPPVYNAGSYGYNEPWWGYGSSSFSVSYTYSGNANVRIASGAAPGARSNNAGMPAVATPTARLAEPALAMGTLGQSAGTVDTVAAVDAALASWGDSNGFGHRHPGIQ